tara:strand:- start:1422 stop:1586 length:165 start_codon:yes stop_codon:yes gene_type:complete
VEIMVRKKDKPHMWLLEDPLKVFKSMFESGDISKKEYKWAKTKRAKLVKRYGEK